MPNRDIQNLVVSQKEYYSEGETHAIAFRISQLKKLKKLILDNEKKITQALYSDLGKSDFEAYTTEIGIVLEEIGHFIKKTKKWSRPKCVSDPLTSFPSRSKIIPEPYGVCLIIAPWNYPFHLAVAPLVAAIAAGNCAVVKPSEMSTATSVLLEQLINQVFEPRYIHIVNGDAQVSSALLEQPFDMIFFTGSPRVGKIVMKAAAEQLIPVVLELGGKSPVVVDKTANIPLAAKRIIWGKSINAGQTCIAPDYVLVEASVQDELILEMEKAAIKMFGENPLKSVDYPRMISEANVVRMEHLLQQGHLKFGGQIVQNERFVSLSVLTQPDLDSALMQEEIFGPLLPVIGFTHWHEAIHFIQQKPKPLALYVFTNDKKKLKEILLKTSAGGVTVNDTIMHFTNSALPFGGAGFSGIGSYHGEAGFKAFSHFKPVMYRATWLDIPLRYPPFGNKLKLVKKILR